MVLSASRGGSMQFANRADAGRRLAERLTYLRGQDLVVLGLPRGGVPVAMQVAEALGAPLDVIMVRKLGIPFQPELAMGAIGEDGVRVVNEGVVAMAGVGLEELALVEKRERTELERRAHRFRGDRPRIPRAGHTILAVPGAPPGWEKRIGRDADEFVALETPEPFFAVGQFYRNFSQTTDEEVS